MKARYYLIYGVTLLLFVMSFILFIQASNANIIDNQQSTDLFIEYQSKTKPIAEPKLSSENFLSISGLAKTDLAVKYAGVSFILGSKKNILIDSNGENLDEQPIKGINCPEGQENVNGVCMDVTACKEAFPLTSADKDIGTYVTKNCGSKGTGYCYTSCQTGYRKSGCSCVAVDCSSFPLATSNNNHCNGVKSCKTGDDYKYRCTGCASGYNLTDSGTCTEKKCSDYGSGYLTTSTAHCTKNDIKRVGDEHCYKCTECEEGYELAADSTCSAKQCSTGYATGKTNVSSPCINFTSQIAGKNICNSCTECSSGYYVNTGKCAACTWKSDHTLASCPANCNCSDDRIDPACVLKYKVTSAKPNYYVDGNTCPACTWGGRTLATCPSSCNCSSEACGGSTKYAVSSAQSNHYVSGNSCPECTWASDHTLTSCPGGCNCSSNRVNASCSYKYKITSAQSNHYISGSTCPECSWGSYTLANCPTGCNCSSTECGGATKYYAYSAKQGYTFSNGTCSENACTGYSSTSNSIAYCRYVYSSPCYKGPTALYGCSSCQNGFTKNSTTGTCSPNLTIIYSGSTPIGIAVSSNLAIDIRMTSSGYQTYAQAVSTCSGKTTGGKSWRLPTRGEWNSYIRPNTTNIKQISTALGGNLSTYSEYWTPDVYQVRSTGLIYRYMCYITTNNCINGGAETWNDTTRTLCVFNF